LSDARQADLAASAQIEPDFDQKDLLEGVQDLSGRMQGKDILFVNKGY
jgi:hypothetical protein